MIRQSNSYNDQVNGSIWARVDDRGKTIERIAAETGIKPGRLLAYRDGRKPWTVRDIELVCRRSLGISGWSVLIGDSEVRT
ncbi:hypothetical protein IU459_10795 [Nocardia amamiensis]|uniref:HTH cro/C1-type domain-containing protein n=1 Tax=Nocardia amamiensis TaxID=404578 RepID=A0ABS0CT68_9NOCA|nr:hypothetical protein [Nocardia amamiensis]MBF6298034.1 hypothetical protein [Nocardia amamiensis]